MREPNIKPSDLRRKAENLIRDGKMPDLETLLQVVAEARQKYVPLIEEARKL